MSPPKLGTVLRTARHLRPRQIAAQLRHMLLHESGVVKWGGPPPSLSTRSCVAPFLAAPPHAALLSDEANQRATGVELIRHRIDWPDAIGWDDARLSPLWAYHLHQCDYLRDPAISSSLRGSVLLDWTLRHPAGVGWDPHPTSLRILTWGKLLLTAGALELDGPDDGRIRASLGQQASTLARNLEVRLQANHLLSNLIGVVFAGLLFEGEAADEWLAQSGMLRAELAEQVPADGLHYERSPMYHALLLENVLDLLNMARSTPERAPAALVRDLEACASRMLGALPVVVHPDGDIALFADAALGVAQAPSALAHYGASLGVGPSAEIGSTALLRDAGYVRLEEGRYCLIASAAGPAPPYMPGHSHCDALAFELSVGGRRVVTDTGVFEYVPGAARARARATASHSTLQIAGAEQSEIWSAFRIGGRARVRLGPVAAGRAEASCEAFATRGTVHRRSFAVGADGVRIRDALEGRDLPVRFPLPLAPGLEPELSSQGAAVSARIDLGETGVLRIDLPGGLAWQLERAPYYPEFSLEVDRACLVGEGRLADGAELRLAVE